MTETTDDALAAFEGTSRRWDGYLEFQRRPEPMLRWFEEHLPAARLGIRDGSSALVPRSPTQRP